jgi:hypothetical protein
MTDLNSGGEGRRSNTKGQRSTFASLGKDYGVDRGLQGRTPALFAEMPHASGLRCHIHRNGRSAAQPRPAPPIARCSTCATRRTKPRDANCHWMKIQWQVRDFEAQRRFQEKLD